MKYKKYWSLDILIKGILKGLFVETKQFAKIIIIVKRSRKVYAVATAKGCQFWG